MEPGSGTFEEESACEPAVQTSLSTLNLTKVMGYSYLIENLPHLNLLNSQNGRKTGLRSKICQIYNFVPAPYNADHPNLSHITNA